MPLVPPASPAETVQHVQMTPAWVQRLAGRARRVYDLAPDAPTQVVKRNPVVAASGETSSARAFPDQSQPRRGFSLLESGGGPMPTAIQPSTVNVDQLTDQVLRQLDRRLIASRERLGRI